MTTTTELQTFAASMGQALTSDAVTAFSADIKSVFAQAAIVRRMADAGIPQAKMADVFHASLTRRALSEDRFITAEEESARLNLNRHAAGYLTNLNAGIDALPEWDDTTGSNFASVIGTLWNVAKNGAVGGKAATLLVAERLADAKSAASAKAILATLPAGIAPLVKAIKADLGLTSTVRKAIDAEPTGDSDDSDDSDEPTATTTTTTAAADLPTLYTLAEALSAASAEDLAKALARAINAKGFTPSDALTDAIDAIAAEVQAMAVTA